MRTTRHVSIQFGRCDRTNHLDPKIFFTHELEGTEINVTAVSSHNNIADVIIKSLPSTHWKHVGNMDMRKLKDCQVSQY